MGTSHHSHSCDEHHSHNEVNVRQLKRVMGLTIVFMCFEAVGGWYTNSLALMSDAAHMLTDTAAIGLSLFAFWMSARPATSERTYGYYRLEILAAFINGIFLTFLSVVIIFGAWQRYKSPVEVRAVQMFWISAIGFCFNIVGAWLLTHGHHHHPNVRGALFHVLGDALGSFGAMVAAVLLHFFHWGEADAIVSVIIACIIIASSFKLILDTAHMIIEGAPSHLDVDEIRRCIGSAASVKEVHDLHVWSITSGMVALSVHVVASGEESRHVLLCSLRDMLKGHFNIEHVTIQIEDESLKKQEPHI